jgi:hypothetical protein
MACQLSLFIRLTSMLVASRDNLSTGSIDVKFIYSSFCHSFPLVIPTQFHAMPQKSTSITQASTQCLEVDLTRRPRNIGTPVVRID